MSRPSAHPGVAIAFSLAMGLAIVLTGPLVLFAPPLVSFMQARHEVAQRLGTDRATVDRATAAMLGDILFAGDFATSIDGREPVLDVGERRHMQDVSGVVRTLVLAETASLGVILLAGRRLRTQPRRRAGLMLMAAGGVGGMAVLLAATFALAFDTAFTIFHLLFFPGGGWQFRPDSTLIRFFPQPMWFELALLAGAVIVLGAAAVMFFAIRELRRTAPLA